MWQNIAVAIIVAGVIPATGFPLLYARSPWRRSPVGRALMTKAVGMALLIDFAVLAYFTPWDTPVWAEIAVYFLVVAGIWLQFGALIHTRLTSRHDTFDPTPPPESPCRRTDPPGTDFRDTRGHHDKDTTE